MGRRLWPLLILSAAAACGAPDGSSTDQSSSEDAPVVEGWQTDWSKATIDTSELVRGIGAADPRDQIPPLDEPSFVGFDEADQWLDDREPVALLQAGGETRAYPVQILTWHEIVNDEVGGIPVAITYCPLCNTAIGFDRRLDGRILRFGTSGLLRNSDLVMWDRETESLWQQATGEAIVGELAGAQLTYLPVSLISWKDFREAYPDGKVLSRDTGFSRAYGTNPYEFYDSASAPFLFDGEIDDRYPAMERVVGVQVGNEVKGYPFSVLEDERVVNDIVGGQDIAVLWGSEDTASALDAGEIKDGRAVGVGIAYSRVLDGESLNIEWRDGQFVDRETGSNWNILGEAVSGPRAGSRLDPVVHANHLWFAWAAFFPDADVYGGG